jgi:hypothetical protein
MVPDNIAPSRRRPLHGSSSENERLFNIGHFEEKSSDRRRFVYVTTSQPQFPRAGTFHFEIASPQELLREDPTGMKQNCHSGSGVPSHIVVVQ